MAAAVDVNVAVRGSKILYGVYSSVDQKLCSEWYACHGNGSACCRNGSAGGKVAGGSAALCTVAVCGESKGSKVSSL